MKPPQKWKERFDNYLSTMPSYYAGVCYCVAFNREEKSLCPVAMVAKILHDNKPKKSLKSIFALF